MDIKITKTENPKVIPDKNAKLGFGTIFTDHMFIANWNEKEGWYNHRIVPYNNLVLSPAMSVFHYGGAVFEGMKAYRRTDGQVQLFRPDENAKRLNVSAQRMGLPTFDESDFVEAVKALVTIDEAWVPSSPDSSLYIRPFLIASDVKIGIQPIADAMFMIIASPSSPYFGGALESVKIMIENHDVRAVRGGTGYTKCAGNYGCSMRALLKAKAKGYAQVLWLDGVSMKYIEEVGAMNFMFRCGNKVYTPSLDRGTILSGITRKSCIQVIKDMGYQVVEKDIKASWFIKMLKKHKVDEAFGCGTAAVISPVGVIEYNGVEYPTNSKVGELSQKLYDTITDIQYGRQEDRYSWIVKL